MISQAEINAKMTPAGGWTKAALAEWGVPWPPPKGWQQLLKQGRFGPAPTHGEAA